MRTDLPEALELGCLLKSPGEQRSKHPIARPRRWQQVGVGGTRDDTAPAVICRVPNACSFPKTWLRVTQGNGLSSHHCGDHWGKGPICVGTARLLTHSSCDRRFTGPVCRVEPGRWEKGAGVGMKNDRGLSDQSPALSQRRHMQRRAGDTGQVCDKEDLSSRVLTSAPQPSLCVLASATATPPAAPPWAHSSYGHRGLSP